MAAVAKRASESLRQAPDAWQAIAFVTSIHSSIDKLVAVSIDSESKPEFKPECKAGCSFCCSVRVEVSDPEALAIAAHVQGLQQSLKTGLIEKLLLQRARQYAEPATPKRIACAFLESDLCAIYAIRPSVCRKAHSLSAKACEDHAPEIPQSLEVLLSCEVITAGAKEAFLQNGLSCEDNELSVAVLAALSVESAVESATVPAVPHDEFSSPATPALQRKAENWFAGKPLVFRPGAER